MANLVSLLTLGELNIVSLDADPRTGGGYAAEIGSYALINNTSSPSGEIFVKVGAGNTAWEKVSTVEANGSIADGIANRLALYPASDNQVDDVLIQNGQNISVAIAAQGSRTTALTYTLPNPGNAVTSADVVLTEGDQTINGNKTFSNDVIVNGNLDVNGTLTTIDAVNLQISDKLITLNRGGSAASGSGSGIEIEENALITAYIKQNNTRDGFSILTSASAHEAELLLSSLTASRSFTLPDVSTVLVGKAGTPTAGHASYWNDANQLASEQFLNVSRGGTGLSGATAGNGVLLIGNGSGYTLANLSQGANQGVSITNGAGSISLQTVQDIRTSASPSFTGLTLSGLTTGVVHADGSGVLSSSSVVLTSEVSGVLPIANGGTNSSTALNNSRLMVSAGGAIVEHSAMSAGAIYFGAPTTGLPLQDATNLVWDDTNNRLGIGTASPQDALHVAGKTRISGAGSTLSLLAESDLSVSQAATTTTDATTTTLATVATTTDTVTLVEVRISGRRTGGIAGTAGDSATYIRTARIKNVSGTASISNLQSDFTSEDQNGWNGTITVTGANILVRVTGAANNNITWQCSIIKTVV